ncbi:unnamed protein product [Plutella xylostella]|uniref:(diamondback moth) hypothetical protein n=1 Tax=Plutella xylostella TaxID=51655 RepID=A0A8S4DD28_PLUXY|nr:unnamed protein product [Plutella xylostella]
MFLQGRVIIVWLSWLIGGISGVIILLIIICYCRLMPRHQKSFDEQYLKESYIIKENHAYHAQENYKVKHAEVCFKTSLKHNIIVDIFIKYRIYLNEWVPNSSLY